VGLDSPDRLDENAAVATSFKPMKAAGRFELYRYASSGLADVAAPWERQGYIDGERVA
jgi:hypothetical protein